MERASHGAEGFFDVERRLEAISPKGDPLETIKKVVPWEDFRADIEAVTETKPEQRKSNAGRKPCDAILKFKIVVLQSLHNCSDEQTEYLIRDRMSFTRFLDLELEDPVTDVSRGVGAAGEITSVAHAFQPSGRFSTRLPEPLSQPISSYKGSQPVRPETAWSRTAMRPGSREFFCGAASAAPTTSARREFRASLMGASKLIGIGPPISVVLNNRTLGRVLPKLVRVSGATLVLVLIHNLR